MSDVILADVFREQQRAKAKHGDKYVANLPVLRESEMQQLMLNHVWAAGVCARLICDGENPTQVAVFIEEVAEALEGGVLRPDEMVQALAMGLGILGIEAGDA